MIALCFVFTFSVTMGSKRKGGVCNLNSSSESGDGRKISFRQTFRIHSSRTESNREKRKKAATEISITLDETTSERKIRDILTGKLPRLRGKRLEPAFLHVNYN